MNNSQRLFLPHNLINKINHLLYRFYLSTWVVLTFGFCSVYNETSNKHCHSERSVSAVEESQPSNKSHKREHMGEKLTKRQREILDFITSFIESKGYAPSFVEIAKKFKLNSVATVHQHIQALKAKGYLQADHNEKRGLELIEDVKEAINTAAAIHVPFAGLITAGEPIEAVEDKDTMAVPTDLINDPINTYVLKVKGDSMIEDGILDGDMVVVQRNPSPRNGDVVVALLDNTYATLKRFYREANRIRLQPANAKLKPIYVKDVIIQGVVKAVIRKFQTI